MKKAILALAVVTILTVGANKYLDNNIDVTQNLAQVVSLTSTAELPRQYIDTNFPNVNGTTRTVPTGTDGNANGQAFQAALNAAQPGDTIVLQAGAQYVGNFTLPVKSNMTNNNWIVIKSSKLSSLPPQGTRVQASDRANMPELITPNSQTVVTTQAGTPAAGGYWFAGIFFGENSSYVVPISGGSWGAGAKVRYVYNLVTLGGAQTSLASVPSRFTFDRTYFYAGPNSSVRRAVAMDSAWTAVVDSRIEGMKEKGSDSQAIYGSNGPGPFKIVNNLLEGAGENVMFGGADPSIQNLVPSDIEIRGNYLFKPLAWRNGTWTVKNSFETKNNQRVLFEGNVLENSWQDGQDGISLTLKSSNQNGRCPWCVSRDLTVKNNVFMNAWDGIGLHGGDDYSNGGVIGENHLTIENNLFLNMGQNGNGKRLLKVTGGGKTTQTDVKIIRNTMISYTDNNYADVFEFDGVGYVMDGMLVRDNIFALLGNSGNPSGFAGSGVSSGVAALSMYAKNSVIQGNVIIGATDNFSSVVKPVSGVMYVAKRLTDFVDPTNQNFRLTSNSPFKGKASDGGDPGADWNQVLNATKGAVTGNWNGTFTPPPVVTTPPVVVTTPTTNLSLSTTSITSGQSTTVTWSSTNATNCTAGGAWSGGKGTSGTASLSPSTTSTYTLTCTGAGGTSNPASVSVSVTPAVVAVIPPVVIVPPVSSTPTCGVVPINSFVGCYYDNIDLTNLVLTRNDAGINFDWAEGTPAPLVGADTFSVRWEGDFNFNAGDYTFTTTSDDGARLFVDGGLVIDKWVNQSATSYTATKTMAAGIHRIKLEYYDNTYDAVAKLSWTTNSSPAPTVPEELIGDINDDGIVNSLDSSIMSAKWFTSYAPADLNHDSVVNSIDFSVLNRNWLKTSSN